MSRVAKSLAGLATGVGLVLALGAAVRPTVLAHSSGGLWEVEGANGRSSRVKLCLRDPTVLAQYEHRNDVCTRVVVRDRPAMAEIHYTCTGGGFGQTTISSLTPRSLRIETQGISGDAPFHYVLQARRIGNC
jgi:hypothetical protein